MSSRLVESMLPERLINLVTVNTQVICVELGKHDDLWTENVPNGQAARSVIPYDLRSAIGCESPESRSKERADSGPDEFNGGKLLGLQRECMF